MSNTDIIMSRARRCVPWLDYGILFDWLFTALLYALSCLDYDALIGQHCRPYHPTDPTLDFPLVESTVGDTEVAAIFAFPIVLILFVEVLVIPRLDKSFINSMMMHNAILGYLQSNAVTLLLTRPIKMFVGRLRPDWLPRLREAGYNETQMADWATMCASTHPLVLEGRKSFPSGHSSASMCEMVFLVLYLQHRLRVLQRGNFAWLVASLSPLFLALFVCASRMHNFWHHGSDVVGGALIGACVGVVTFKLNFFVSRCGRFMVPRTRSPLVLNPNCELVSSREPQQQQQQQQTDELTTTAPTNNYGTV